MKLVIRYWFEWRHFVNDCRQENVKNPLPTKIRSDEFRLNHFQAQLRSADRYYELILLRKCFTILRDNVNDERREQFLVERADSHYR